MKQVSRLLTLSLFTTLSLGCGHGHDHADGHSHDGDEAASAEDGGSDAEDGDEHEHEHEEVSLGTAAVGDLMVELAQGHGVVAAGEEGHLVVKLPYNDGGASTVRAWIGTADRTLSYVGKGDYAPSHDDYDVHASAPDPMPDGARWWVEVEKPDGTKSVGSAEMLR